MFGTLVAVISPSKPRPRRARIAQVPGKDRNALMFVPRLANDCRQRGTIDLVTDVVAVSDNRIDIRKGNEWRAAES